MRRVLLPCLLLLPLIALGQPKPPPRDKAAALKLFASELVEITPGKGKFPAELKMGTADGWKGNAWGRHGMHGYGWEWVADSWHPDCKDAPADGSAWKDRDAKKYVVRGGGFNSTAEQCRSAAREGRDANFKSDNLGFRCVR